MVLLLIEKLAMPHLDLLLTTEGILRRLDQDVLNFKQTDSRSRHTKATRLSQLKEQLAKRFFAPTNDEG